MTNRPTEASRGADPSLDATVERVTRWTAGRTTRRSFVHRFGQFVMVLAAGPTIAGLLLKRAEARVCGQSGVTPKCETFDCNGPNDVWGWCWYASDGCCRNDGLKKICDCCTVNYPNVHGYCPSGTNVRCIVESCGSDPRVLDVTLTPLSWELGGYSRAAIRTGQFAAIAAREKTASRLVVAPESDVWAQYVAGPLAGTLGVPLITIDSAGPDQDIFDLASTLGVTKVLAVGRFPTDIATPFQAAGLGFESVADTADWTQLSVQVAEAIGRVNDINRTVTIEPTGLSGEAAPLAAIMAALNGFPIAIGSTATGAIGLPTLYVGPEPADVGVPAIRTTASDLLSLSTELADLAAAAPFVESRTVALAPQGSADLIDLVNVRAPVVLHPPQRLGQIEAWLQDHSVRYGLMDEVYFTRGPGELTTDEYWRLQGAVNGFRVDQLTGRPGEGLPVTRQPWSERPVGMARTDGSLPLGSEGPPGYWTELGQTLRQ